MPQSNRISVQEVRNKLHSGAQILLVCAYPSDAKFQQAPLDGAISFREFERRRASLPRDIELVFY